MSAQTYTASPVHPASIAEGLRTRIARHLNRAHTLARRAQVTEHPRVAEVLREDVRDSREKAVGYLLDYVRADHDGAEEEAFVAVEAFLSGLGENLPSDFLGRLVADA